MNPVFRLDEALSRVDHDRDIFITMVELFSEHGPKDFAVLKAAVQAGNPSAVAQSAHRLKGAVMQFCASATFASAKKLEDIGRAGQLTDAESICAQLETELADLLDALQQARDTGFGA
ncbi:MAG: Hpt domain-containing protein [Nitrospira sp.]|nr:Hpt domain-containing protein [Nitrospira sp.]